MKFASNLEYILFLIFLTFIWACLKNFCIWILDHSSYISFLNKFFANDFNTFDTIFHIVAYVFIFGGTSLIGALCYILLFDYNIV